MKKNTVRAPSQTQVVNDINNLTQAINNTIKQINNITNELNQTGLNSTDFNFTG